MYICMFMLCAIIGAYFWGLFRAYDKDPHVHCPVNIRKAIFAGQGLRFHVTLERVEGPEH